MAVVASLLTASVTVLVPQSAHAGPNDCYTFTKDCTNPQDARWNCANWASTWDDKPHQNAYGKVRIQMRYSVACNTAWARTVSAQTYCFSANYACTGGEIRYMERSVPQTNVMYTIGLSEYSSSAFKWSKQIVDHHQIRAVGWQHWNGHGTVTKATNWR